MSTSAKTAKFWEKFYAREILAPEADLLCKWRDCYAPGQDKGSYSQGRGYTSYYDKPLPVCMTRMCHGCPSGPVNEENRVMRPEPDWAVILKDLGTKCKIGGKRERDKALSDLLNVSSWMVQYLKAYSHHSSTKQQQDY
jgi:hypothetical protein